MPIVLVTLLALLLALGLPAAGVWLAGKPLALYLEFPPITRYVRHAGFSWTVFVLMASALVLTLSPFLLRLRRWKFDAQRSTFSGLVTPRRPFPWWGWLALATGAAAWLLAWTRFAWFAPLQLFTFSPLWFSYIGAVNALTWKRTGRCMLLHQRRKFILLFLASAAFWWYFEYLNRFVQNWYYVGVTGLTPAQYFIFATLPFSTVLPAVMGTCDLLHSVSCFRAWEAFTPLSLGHPRALAAMALLAGAVTLACIGVWPDYFFPLLWVSPLLIMTGLQALSGRPTIFAPLAAGNWRRICLLSLSALICGVFWEMWNYHSLAKWVYAVPYVQRFRIFEMPLLGYAGYLPFGLECAVIADAVAGEWRKGRA